METALKFTVTADVADAVANLGEAAAAAEAVGAKVAAMPQNTEVKATADTGQAQEALSDLSDKSDLPDKEIKVGADTDEAAAAAEEVGAKVAAVPQNTEVKATADTGQAQEALSDLSDKSDLPDKKVKVGADTSQAVSKMAMVKAAVSQAARVGGRFVAVTGIRALAKAADGAVGALGRVAKAAGKAAAAGGSWALHKAAAAAKWAVLGAAGAVGAGTVALGKFAASAESTRLAFRTMLGSIAMGDAMMAKLDRFSNSTPYSGDQVNKAAKTLLAFGVEAGNVENTLRKVGDVASGSGKDFNELAAIYGKVFAKGTMDTEAMNQMVEAGIPIVKTLGAQFGKSGKEIYAMAEKGEITAAAVDRAFAQMSGSGGVFAGMMQKQSESLSGIWGAITGQIAYAASNIGEALLPLLKVVLGYFQGWADKIAEMSADGSLIRWFGRVAVSGVTAVGELIKWSVTLANHFTAAFKTIGAWGRVLWNGLKAGLMGVITGVVAIFESLVNAAVSAYNAVVRFFGGKGKEITWTWTQATAETTADSARDTAAAFSEATDGRYFANAMSDNARFDAAVNRAVGTINTRLSSAVEKAAEAQAKRSANIDAQLKKGAIPDEIKEKKEKSPKSEKADFDRFTRIGLYNASSDVRSLDIERNNLIRKLLNKPAVEIKISEV